MACVTGFVYWKVAYAKIALVIVIVNAVFVTFTNVADPVFKIGSVIEHISVVAVVKLSVVACPVKQSVYCKVPAADTVILYVSH